MPRKFASLILLCATFVVPAVTVSPSLAQIITLTDNNSVAQINTGSAAGMFNWFVDGHDYLAQQWFWYRVGNDGPESSINNISAPSISTPDARTLDDSYSNGAYGVLAHYHLTGSSPGSGLSRLDETITITNAGEVALDFHFFQYSDFDLGPIGDTIQLGKDIFGLFNEAAQSGGGGVLSETVVTPGANHGEAGLFPVTLNKLNDGVATTLNDVTGPIGPGDATWALEWDFTILPHSSVGISKQKTLAVPEPNSIVLAGLGVIGLAAWGWRRRRR